MKNKKRIISTKLVLTVLSVLMLVGCGATPYRPVVSDKDNDKVVDADDQCPLTPPANPVDEKGCALFRGSIEAVEFEPGSDTLNARSRESLAKLVTLINQHPDVVLQLGGHTDNLGSARENLALSKRRVMSVVKYLVANGVDGERLKPFGFGESRPIVSNMTAAGRAQNRRIEISVITQ